MRILTVSNLYPPIVEGGYEARCAATVESLRATHDVLVLTSIRGRESCPADAGVLRELPFLNHGKRSVIRAPIAAAKGIEVMRTAIADFKPDLIFVWNGSGIPHSALRVAELSGVPMAYSVGEHWLGRIYTDDPYVRCLLPGEHGLHAVWGRIPRLLNHLPALQVDPLTPARAAICWNSEATRRICGLPDTLKPTLETTIYPGIPEPERWTSLQRRPSEQPTIAFVGRLEPAKGPDVAYRALAVLRDQHGIDARLVLAGACKPPMRAELDRLAAELGIAAHVELLGPVDRAGVGNLLEQAHTLVVPSTWEEPFGLVLLEGALARVPVVAARSGGMPEALREHEARFFPIGNHVACAEALAVTLHHSSNSEGRVDAAYRRAQELSFDRYIAEMEQFVSDAHASFSPTDQAIGSPV